jgi:uncharacterized protein YdaU (DUF1376 family)
MDETYQNKDRELKQSNSYWFKHNYNASSDKKLLIIRSKLGFEGIGIYWAIVEYMYNNDGFLEEDLIDVFCNLNKIAREKIDIILKTAFKKTTSDGAQVYYAHRIAQEISAKEDCIDKARKAAYSRWEKYREKKKQEKKDESIMDKVNKFIEKGE